MINIFRVKKVEIPTGESKEVSEIESYTLRWEIQDNGYKQFVVQHKCFIHESEANEFKNQLELAAKFLGTWVRVYVYKN